MNATAEYDAVRSLSSEDLVEQYADLVRRIAYHLAGRLPASVEVADLIQAGMLGLIEAAGRYTGSRGARFETYAGIRIRGAMLDELRKTDWTPRSVHRRVREMVEAIRQLEARLSRRPRDVDIAAEMGVSLDEYHEIAREAVFCRMLSTEDLSPVDSDSGVVADKTQSPERELQEEAVQAALTEAIEALPEREKLVMNMYYDDELNLREIGAVLEVSESRICQLHGQALARLRARLSS